MRSLILASLLAATFTVPALAQDAPPPGAAPYGQPQGHSHEGLKQKFDAANTSHDGRLTADQAEAGGMHAIAKHWDQIDTSHKGYITFAELRAYHHAKAASKHSGQQGPGGSQGPGGQYQGQDQGGPNGPPPSNY